MRKYTLLILLFCALPLFGEVVIVPPAPTTNDTVFVRVRNNFGANGRVVSASMVRTGNTFTIQQAVEIACTPVPPPPEAPYLTSEFQLPQLAPGAYDVSATITITTCGREPFAQAQSFLVAQGTVVPVMSPQALLLMAAALVALGFVAVRAR